MTHGPRASAFASLPQAPWIVGLDLGADLSRRRGLGVRLVCVAPLICRSVSAEHDPTRLISAYRSFGSVGPEGRKVGDGERDLCLPVAIHLGRQALDLRAYGCLLHGAAGRDFGQA